EFLDRFERDLHNRAANRVVLVIETVDGHVYVATVLAVDGQNCVAILSWIVGVSRFHTGSEIREVSHVASKEWELLHLFRCDVLAHIRFGLVDKRYVVANLDRFTRRAGFNGQLARGWRSGPDFHGGC